MNPQFDTPVGTGGAINTNTGQILSGALSGQQAGTTGTYAPTMPAAINSSNLQASSPITIPPTPSATATTGLNGYIGATTDQFTKNLADTAATAKTANDNSLQSYIDSIGNSSTKGTLTNDAYAATVDPAQKELSDINNQILAERVATNHAVDNLNANPGSMSRDALSAQVNSIQRQSLSKQADLSVIQMAKQGQFDSAKAIADRAVQAKFEQDQQKNDMLKYVYEQNKSNFTTAEQRSFEVAQADRQSALDLAKQKELARYNELIKTSDPLYQAQVKEANANVAKTYADIAATNMNGSVLAQTNVRTTTSGINYVDGTNLTGKDATQAQLAAAKAGVPYLDKTSADLQNNVETARQNMNNIASTLNGLLPTSGVQVGNRLSNQIQAYLDIGPKADALSSFNAYRSAAIQALRAMAGAKGLRINQAEILQSVNNDIPKVTDSVGVAQRKIAIVNSLLDSQEKGTFGSQFYKPSTASGTGTIVTAPDGKQIIITD